jgi:CRP-like cAMP-binding protein
MPTPEQVSQLLKDAAESGRCAQDARNTAERYYRHRRQVVIELRDAGVSFAVIAKQLGVSRSGVQAILR